VGLAAALERQAGDRVDGPVGVIVGAGSSSATLRCGSTGRTRRGWTNGVIGGSAPRALGDSSSRERPFWLTSTPVLVIIPIFISSRRVRPDATVSWRSLNARSARLLAP
jgi:hypothetical protein